MIPRDTVGVSLMLLLLLFSCNVAAASKANEHAS